MFRFRVDFENGNCSSTGGESFKRDGGTNFGRSFGVWRRVLQLENGLAIPKVIALEIQTLVLRRIESYSCL